MINDNNRFNFLNNFFFCFIIIYSFRFLNIYFFLPSFPVDVEWENLFFFSKAYFNKINFEYIININLHNQRRFFSKLLDLSLFIFFEKNWHPKTFTYFSAILPCLVYSFFYAYCVKFTKNHKWLKIFLILAMAIPASIGNLYYYSINHFNFILITAILSIYFLTKNKNNFTASFLFLICTFLSMETAGIILSFVLILVLISDYLCNKKIKNLILIFPILCILFFTLLDTLFHFFDSYYFGISLAEYPLYSIRIPDIHEYKDIGLIKIFYTFIRGSLYPFGSLFLLLIPLIFLIQQNEGNFIRNHKFVFFTIIWLLLLLIFIAYFKGRFSDRYKDFFVLFYFISFYLFFILNKQKKLGKYFRNYFYLISLIILLLITNRFLHSNHKKYTYFNSLEKSYENIIKHKEDREKFIEVCKSEKFKPYKKCSSLYDLFINDKSYDDIL